MNPHDLCHAKQAVAKRKGGLLRWCHAHPTWTYWALLFLGNLLLKRYLATWLQHQLQFDSGRCNILNPFGSSTACTLGHLFQLFWPGHPAGRVMVPPKDLMEVALAPDFVASVRTWGLFVTQLSLTHDGNPYQPASIKAMAEGFEKLLSQLPSLKENRQKNEVLQLLIPPTNTLHEEGTGYKSREALKVS